MGVDFTAIAGYGYKITAKEAISLIRDLDLLDEETEDLSDEDLFQYIQDIFDTKDTACYRESADAVVIVDEASHIETGTGEVKRLSTKNPTDNRLLQGIAERLNKKPGWVLYAYMW